MDKITTGNSMAVTKEVITSMQDAYTMLHSALVSRSRTNNQPERGYSESDEPGNNPMYIVAGLLGDNTSRTDGVILLLNELIPFVGGATLANFKIVTENNTISGDDEYGQPFSTVINRKYAMFDNAGSYVFSDLKRADIASRRSEIAEGVGYLSTFATGFSSGGSLALCHVNQFGKLNVSVKLTRTATQLPINQNILLFTLPANLSLAVPYSLERFYFTVYVRSGSNGAFMLPCYVDKATRNVYIDAQYPNVTIVEGDVLYLSFEYYVA